MADTSTVTNSKRSRDAIRTALDDRAGGVTEARAVAEATIGTWCPMDRLLAPVIGTQGVDVNFRRALYLTSKTFPWLACEEECRERAVLLANIKVRLENRCADDVAEAGYTLLVCCTELLSTLIGEALTERVLAPVWASQSSAEQEIES